MNFNQTILKNLKRNIRHYAMYIFSLTMSIMLFFGFVTLQYSDDLTKVQSGNKIEAGIKAGVTLLIIIITIFLLYTNKLFIKRRSREIGLYQLIGMTRKEVFKIFAIENIVLFIITAIIGTTLGILSSKVLFMILYKILEVKQAAFLEFSMEALMQTLALLLFVFIVLMIQNSIFIKRKTILSLMNEHQATDTKIKKIKFYEILFGIAGILMIVYGYYISTIMFETSASYGMMTLYYKMLATLFLTIVGAYLLFRCSISVIFNTLRKSKKGMLSVSDVVSTSSIMHKMKTNALSLTIISVVSALAVGLLALSYVSYYNVEETSRVKAPNDYIFIDKDEVNKFTQALNDEQIQYTEKNYDTVHFKVDDTKVIKPPEDMPEEAESSAVLGKSSQFKGIDVKDNEVAIVGFSDILSEVTKLNEDEKMSYKINNETKKLKVKDIVKESPLSNVVSLGGPVYVVSDDVYEQMKAKEDKNEDARTQYGLDLKNSKDLEKADKIFNQQVEDNSPAQSYNKVYQDSKSTIGVMLFVLGFLGIAFLLSTGCIIYIKQIDETEDEMSNYSILRKLGYTSSDMSRGIAFKIAFNFALPLLVGLSHGYFAAKSAWFLIGQSFYTPVFIVMGMYSIIYILFALLAYTHSKYVIQRAL